MEKIRLGVSSCLLGEAVRYDGGHKLDRFLTGTLGQYVEYVPVCPEVECGLPVPRESMHLEGDIENPRLVTTRTGRDMTDRMGDWAARRVRELEKEDLCGFIFKSGSPSSGMERVKVFNAKGMPEKKGVGLFARAFMEHFPRLPVTDEGRLHDPVLRESFIEAVFTLKRWRHAAADRRTRGQLVEFHTRHKLLLLSHSRRHHQEMGRLVAAAKEQPIATLFDRYEELLTDAMRLKSTRKKNTDVIMHVMGHFKKDLSADEKQELLQLIGRYHEGLVPLVVPITLLNHYVRKYDKPYLKDQYYLDPHPAELMLRNHP